MKIVKYQDRKDGRFKQWKMDRAKLNLMLSLRAQGWAYRALGDFFNINKEAVKYYCVRHGISYKGKPLFVSSKWIEIKLEMMNKGRNYADYLKEWRSRSPSNR